MSGDCWRVAVVSGKGGVGKTTTVINLAAALAQDGRRCLVVDCDPQANLTFGVGLHPGDPRPTIADVLRGERSAVEAIATTPVDGVDLLPAGPDLVGVEATLTLSVGRELLLRDALAAGDIHERYDVILFDTPPTFGFHAINALGAADHVLVPLQISGFALRGLGDTRRVVAVARRTLNPELRLLGAVPTFVDRRTRFCRDMLEGLEGLEGVHIFENAISRSVRLLETSLSCTPITAAAPTSRSADEFRALAREVAVRLGGEPALTSVWTPEPVACAAATTAIGTTAGAEAAWDDADDEDEREPAPVGAPVTTGWLRGDDVEVETGDGETDGASLTVVELDGVSDDSAHTEDGAALVAAWRRELQADREMDPAAYTVAAPPRRGVIARLLRLGRAA